MLCRRLRRHSTGLEATIYITSIPRDRVNINIDERDHIYESGQVNNGHISFLIFFDLELGNKYA